MKEYEDFVKMNPKFDPVEHLDDIVNNVLQAFSEIEIDDFDEERKKKIILDVLQKDPQISAWRAKTAEDIKNNDHPSCIMVGECQTACANLKQSEELQHQVMNTVIAHIGTCITIINSAHVLNYDVSKFLDHEIYQITYEKFIN